MGDPRPGRVCPGRSHRCKIRQEINVGAAPACTQRAKRRTPPGTDQIASVALGDRKPETKLGVVISHLDGAPPANRCPGRRPHMRCFTGRRCIAGMRVGMEISHTGAGTRSIITGIRHEHWPALDCLMCCCCGLREKNEFSKSVVDETKCPVGGRAGPDK